MNILELAKGQKMSIMTDAKIEVILEIAEIKEQNHSQDLEPATRANDWWPASRDWTTFDVIFTNGFTKSFNSLKDINFID